MNNNEHMKAHRNVHSKMKGKTFSITLKSQMEKKGGSNKIVAVTKIHECLHIYVCQSAPAQMIATNFIITFPISSLVFVFKLTFLSLSLIFRLWFCWELLYNFLCDVILFSQVCLQWSGNGLKLYDRFFYSAKNIFVSTTTKIFWLKNTE